jgi:hypothetical protein
MLGPSETLLMYYLGFGFVILLGWAVAHPDRALDSDVARRGLRSATLAAVAGILHPALALAARDIVAQIGQELPAEPSLATTHRRATATANACTVLSLVPVAVIVALTLT